MASNIFGKLSAGLKFWAGPRSTVGIDIGTSSVKVVQLRKEKERALLETYGELATALYLKRSIGQIVQLPEDTVVMLLKDLFKEAGVTAKEAVVSIPVKNSFVTIIKLPLVGGKGDNMEEMLRFEARKYVPVPLNEVEMDWQIISREEGGNSHDGAQKAQLVEVLLVVVHKDVIQKYFNIIKKAGLKIRLFEVEMLSAWRSSLFRPIAPAMIMDLGASSTKMSVMDAGVLRASYSVDKGAQLITQSISNSLNISFERAEELKQELGLSPKPEHKELVKVIELVLNFIFAEAKQFMLTYSRKHDGSVNQVILIGGGALLKGMMDFAVKKLGVEILRADPFARTEYPVFLQETLREIGPSFSVATGLALKSFNR